MAIKGTFHWRKRPPAPIFSTLQRFSVLRTSKRCFPTPATMRRLFFHSVPCPALALDSARTEGSSKLGQTISPRRLKPYSS